MHPSSRRLVLVFSLLCFSVSAFTQASQFWKNRLYFKLKDSAPAGFSTLEDLRRNPQTQALFNLLQGQDIQSFRKAFIYTRSPQLDRSFRVILPEDTDARILIGKLQQLDIVEYAELVPRDRKCFTPNDPQISSQYALNLIRAFQAFDLHTGGNSFVAIVDDAVRITHQDLAGNIRVNPDEIPGNNIDDDGNGKVDDIRGWDVADNDSNVNPPNSASNFNFSHGTHCSGIASAVTNNSTGIASIGYNCKILPVKCTGNASNPEFIDEGFDGIDYAAEEGARIISCSWGSYGFSNTINNFINALYNSGVLVVAAAGNDGGSTPHYPSAYLNAIGVAATGSTDAKAGFSNYGTWVDICAPGVGILSTVAGSGGSNTSYANYNGTSMSTPMVAGLLALMLSYDPSMSAADLRSCLLSSADNIDAQNPGFIGMLGSGRIDARSALECVAASGAPTAAFTWSPQSEICPGGKIQFTDASSGNPTSRSWSFPGGTPATSSAVNPLVTYNNAGTYSVSLTVTNANGSGNITLDGIITVGGNGNDNFYWENFENGLGAWTVSNPDNGVTWTTVTALGSRQGTKAAMMGNFTYVGGGNQKDGLVNNTAFDFRGRQSIRLDLDYAYRGRTGGNSDTLNIYVSTDNGSTFPYKVYSGFIGPSGVFQTGTSLSTVFVPGSQADWCFSTANSNCISVDLSAFTGRSQVKIRIENVSRIGNNLYIDNIKLNSSCYESIAPPFVDFSADPLEACQTATVEFFDESSGNVVAWDWSFPGGIPSKSQEQFPVVHYNQPGNYTVTLVATNPGGSETNTKTMYIQVYDTPVPYFEYTINGSVVNFINLSAGGVQQANSYFWDFGDGHTSGATNPQHTYQEDGVYTVRLSATNACGTVDFYQDIQIINIPVAGILLNPTTVCTGYEVQFFDNSQPAPDSWSWSFEGGTPAVSGEQNPKVIYNTPGQYDVRLIVDNSAGSDTILLANYVTVMQAAQAAFSTSVSGLAASFTSTSQGSNLSYQWSFGDNGTASVPNPQHTYAAAGVYDVRLIVSNGCSSDTLLQSVSIQSIPVAQFSGINEPACLPATVQFHDNSQGDITFRKWLFPGGNPTESALADPVVTYAAVGQYNVTLIVGNNAGNDTFLLNTAVTVSDLPIAAFDAIVSGNELTLNNGSSAATSYVWSFGDNTISTLENPGYTYPLNGNYTLTLIASNACGSDTFSVGIEIAVAPVSAFTFEKTGDCSPITIQFQDISQGNPQSWEWSFPGGFPPASNEQNPTVQYSIPGIYPVSLIVRNGDLADTLLMDQLVEVQGTPEPSFSSLTTGLEVQFENQTLFGDSFLWKFGDGNESTEENPLHVYASADTFEVVLIVQNECGTDSIVRTIHTGGQAPQGGILTAKLSGCAPVVVTFEPQNLDDWEEISWSFPGGNPASSSEASPTVTYDAPGFYAVQLTQSNAFGTTVTTVDTMVWVDGIPEAAFEIAIDGTQVQMANTTQGGATSYYWTFGDGGDSNEEAPLHEYATLGEYWITLVASNECGSDTVSTQILLSSSGEINGLHCQIYPNPARDLLWLKVPARSESLTCMWINAIGQQVPASPTRLAADTWQLPLESLAPGIWFLHMRDADRSAVAKILVLK